MERQYARDGGCRGPTYGLNQLPVVQQRLLVLDVARGSPCLDLVSRPLQLLDFLLQRILQLLLLRLIGRDLNLLVNALEGRDAFGDLLEALVDLLLELALCHGVGVTP